VYGCGCWLRVCDLVWGGVGWGVNLVRNGINLCMETITRASMDSSNIGFMAGI